jgi:hypothetical protein
MSKSTFSGPIQSDGGFMTPVVPLIATASFTQAEVGGNYVILSTVDGGAAAPITLTLPQVVGSGTTPDVNYNGLRGSIFNADTVLTHILAAYAGQTVNGAATVSIPPLHFAEWVGNGNQNAPWLVRLSTLDSSGAVTSVGLALPSELTISNSPVTGTGTLTGVWATQTANTVFAGPTTGAAATPAFRAIVVADIPTLNQSTTGSALTIKDNTTTGLMQVTGITAGATRIATIPDANYSVARIDAAQTFTGLQSFATTTATGVMTSTLAIGTAPFSITSTTRVPNLNVSLSGAADALSTTGAAVSVVAAAPPSVGQYLIATAATTATWQTLDLSVPPAIGGTTPSTGAFTLLTGTNTAVSATPGTIRAIYGKFTTFTTMTSGNLVGTRGEVTMGGSVSGTAFLYGAQGKIITGANTIDVGSGYVAGVFGQLDLTGATVTTGYVCGVASDIFGVSSGTVAADLFYGQHADGGTINSFFRAYGNATSVFEFDTNSGTQITTTGTAASPNGHMKVKVNGVTRYLQLYDTP